MKKIGVKDLNIKIKNIIESEYELKDINVEGEITGFKVSGNHAYFKLRLCFKQMLV